MKKIKNKKCSCGCGRKVKRGFTLLAVACYFKQYRAKDKIKTAYEILKFNARRRRKEFTITFEYFKTLCEQTGYIEGKGLSGDSLTIDRIRNDEGYIEGNVRVITKSENSSKGASLDYEELEENKIYVAKGIKENINYF